MRNSVPSRKRSAYVCFCLLLLVGSMWINSQTGGGVMGSASTCQCVLDKATDVSQTERCSSSLDSRFVLAPAPEALQNTWVSCQGEDI